MADIQDPGPSDLFLTDTSKVKEKSNQIVIGFLFFVFFF